MSATDGPQLARDLAASGYVVRSLVVRGNGSSEDAAVAGSHAEHVWIRPLGPHAAPIVASVSGAVTDLPDGPARPEALAVRLRRSGAELAWGEPIELASVSALERLSYQRGKHSVDLLRADHSLLCDLQIGGWFEANARTRLARRLLRRAPRLARLVRVVFRNRYAVSLSADAWFWAGVRSRSSDLEWKRLTRSSYAVLCYHRIAGRASSEGPDWDDVAPKRFRRHMRLLRWLRFTPLSADELLEFHSNPRALLGRRRYLVTADDGYTDALTVLREHAELRPLVFIVAGFARGDTPARWLVGERGASFASWAGVVETQAAGVTIGFHTRRHPYLTACTDAQLRDELESVWDEFRAAGIDAQPILAYPFGAENTRVRVKTRDAGYRLGYTIDAGANGAGTDPFRLHRVMVGGADGWLTFLWKALTGEERPAPLERLRRARSG